MTQRVLTRLGRISPTAAFLGVGVLVFVALVLPGALGGLILLALAAGAGWLLAQTWRAHPPRARVIRLSILALVVLLAVAKLT
ncbi:hypothetical protein OHA72_16945 [Dactylosporangium sp. NBC_01737]|uniref:DUF6703 family protein n=1 Tax=Dactylosporangium sp. NBC_01737 TaxID=2975959 RepID=UPI002E0D91A6|nr:hypothetical protein OHA72_16945 [Dactylosporangium sp. NBC_01737]